VKNENKHINNYISQETTKNIVKYVGTHMYVKRWRTTTLKNIITHMKGISN